MVLKTFTTIELASGALNLPIAAKKRIQIMLIMINKTINERLEGDFIIYSTSYH